MNHDIVIRSAAVDDAAVIRHLSAEALGYDFPLEETARKLEQALNRSSERVFIAELADAAVGYVHAADYDTLYAPYMKNILGIAVAASARRKGVGRALLAAVESWAAETGAAAVRLNSGAARQEAHAFYRQCGYEDSKQQLRFLKSVISASR